MPGTFKLDHYQLIELILSCKFSNFSLFILGGQFLLPQRANNAFRSNFVLSKKLLVPQTFLAAVRQAGGHGLGADEVVADSGTLFRGREAEVDKERRTIPINSSIELALSPHCM